MSTIGDKFSKVYIIRTMVVLQAKGENAGHMQGKRNTIDSSVRRRRILNSILYMNLVRSHNSALRVVLSLNVTQY